MIKMLGVALFTVIGVLLPMGAAQANSPSAACSSAIDMINAAIDANPGGELDDTERRTLAAHLLAIGGAAADREAIAAYAKVLADAYADVGPATDTLNESCAG